MIVLCGSDVFTGSEIWKFYREFEVDEHEDLVELGGDAVDIQKSKERFIKVYNRQLSLPLVGNEETLREFEQRLGDLCVVSDAGLINPSELEKKVVAAKELREGRLLYEMHLFSDKYESSNVSERETFWVSYITYEKKQAQLSRAQRLYERAVLDCSTSQLLWLDFTDFALSTLKNWQLLASVVKRALKVFRSSVFLWRLLFLSLEGSQESAEEFPSLLQAALSSGLGNVEEYLDIYLCHCDYHRRQLESSNSKLQIQTQAHAALPEGLVERAAAQVEALQAALQQVQAFLSSYGTQWVAGWWRFCKYQAQIEATLVAPVRATLAQIEEEEPAGPVLSFGAKATAKKLPKAHKLLPGSEVWETATKLFPTSYFIWSECVTWAKHQREFEHCRKLYRKMTNLQLDVSAAEVCKEWVSFEQQYGSLQEIQAALTRVFPHAQEGLLTAYSASSATAPESNIEVGAMQVDSVPSDANNRKNKRKAAAEAQHEGRTVTVSTASNHPHEEDAKQSVKKVKFDETPVVAPTTAPSQPNVLAALSSATVASSTAADDVITAGPTLSDSVVVVSNFPFHATLESIRPMLEDKCRPSAEILAEAGVATSGSIKGMHLLLSKAGHSRGAVEVEFEPIAQGVAAPALQPFLRLIVSTLSGYVYNERALKAEIKPIPVPGSAAAQKKEKVDPLVLQQRAGSVTAPHLTTVFVSRLGPEVTTAQLQEHFLPCGEVLAAKVAVDKKTGESKVTL